MNWSENPSLTGSYNPNGFAFWDPQYGQVTPTERLNLALAGQNIATPTPATPVGDVSPFSLKGFFGNAGDDGKWQGGWGRLICWLFHRRHLTERWIAVDELEVKCSKCGFTVVHEFEI